MGILEQWSFADCSEGLVAPNQQASPEPGLVSGVRQCTLVPFQGDLWSYPSFSVTNDKSPPCPQTAQPQSLTCREVGGWEPCQFQPQLHH